MTQPAFRCQPGAVPFAGDRVHSWAAQEPDKRFADMWIIRPAPVIAALGDRIRPT
jgi:hypothetical protein